MSRIVKFASAALIALTLVGGAVYARSLGVGANAPMAMPPLCPDGLPEPCIEDDERTAASESLIAWSWGVSNSGG
jgi:hypothetical protein